MRAVVQRVAQARVAVGGDVIGEIDRGLLVFLAVQVDDCAAERNWLADKIANLRCFGDATGRMNRCLRDMDGNALVISQFTLMGELRKGTRPSFNRAELPEPAQRHYAAFCCDLSAALGKPVATGRFAAEMQISAVHDGPVTLILDTRVKGF